MKGVAGDKLILVGNPGECHVGNHLLGAVRSLEVDVRLVDSTEAYSAPWLKRVFNWRLRGRRPARLRPFSRRVVELCRAHRPQWMLATGIAPLAAEAIDAIRTAGVRCLNFLTDDPWNPGHHAPWFLAALPRYDQVFSPRQANISDLRSMGCPAVAYLPFAYNPELHRPESPDVGGRDKLASDVLFVGGADRDRLPWIKGLIRAGLRVALYGGYWGRDRLTRPFHRGHADTVTLRRATAAASVALCLVRRANRDGHVMRTFEIAAMGGCMLAEETAEHRRLLGEEGEAALFFSCPGEMVAKARWLIDRPEVRRQLAAVLFERITVGQNTYRDRLESMLSLRSRSAS